MKKQLYFLTTILLLSLSCSKSSDDSKEENTDNPDSYSGYTLVWNDEFSGSTLDGSKWSYETGTGVNGDWGTGQLDIATNRTENVRIETGVDNADGGCLVIATKKENYDGKNYTSGRINTNGKGSWGAGYRIEARVWPKDVRYKGQGFAFWMMPSEKPVTETYIMWPQGGEIDVMEYVGSIPFNNLGTVHYAWSWENNQYQSWNHGMKGAYYSFSSTDVPAVKPVYGNYPPTVGDPNSGSSGFHLYRIDWFSDRIEFSVDAHVYHIHYLKDGAAFDNGTADGQDADKVETINGKKVFKSEYSNHFDEWHPFEHKFYAILSAGVGGNDNQTYGGAIVNDAVFPCSVYIDWVRVYKRE